MIYSGKEDIPFLMLLGRNRSAAGEALVQQFNAGHTQDGKLTPVRQTPAAAFATSLIREEVHDTFLNTIVVRLDDSILILIGKTQQTSLMNGRQDQLMSLGIHGSRQWVSYYAK